MTKQQGSKPEEPLSTLNVDEDELQEKENNAPTKKKRLVTIKSASDLTLSDLSIDVDNDDSEQDGSKSARESFKMDPESSIVKIKRGKDKKVTSEKEAEKMIQDALNNWRKTKGSSSGVSAISPEQSKQKSPSLKKLSKTISSRIRDKEPLSKSTDGTNLSLVPEKSISGDINRKRLSSSSGKEVNDDDDEIGDDIPTRSPSTRMKNIRRLSQRFNRKSAVEKKPESPLQTIPEKRKPRFKLEKQESEMLLEIVNQKLQAEGKAGVNEKERSWLLKNMGQQVESPPKPKQTVSMKQQPISTLPTGKIKSKTAHIQQLSQKLSLMELNLNELNRKYLAILEEKKDLETKLVESEQENTKLEELNTKLKQSKLELSVKLDTFTISSEEKDKAIDSMEEKMIKKLSKAASRESKLASQLKQSIARQSKMDTQLLQLRGDNKNLEYDRQEALSALEQANNTIARLQTNNSYLNAEISRIKSTKDNLQEKVSTDQQDLKEAYDYIGLLEDSDIKLRTAVALVNKQNKALVGINNNLKQQLGEANAQLAMQKFYNDMDEDIDGNIELLSSSIWDREVPEGPNAPIPIAPDLPPPEMQNILSTIPNYVKKKREQRSQIIEEENATEMADIFAKALLLRRSNIVKDDEEEEEILDESDDEWESDEN